MASLDGYSFDAGILNQSLLRIGTLQRSFRTGVSSHQPEVSVHVPVVAGLIARRLLVSYRVAPGVMARQLPAPFRPRLRIGPRNQ